jgi:hypothetical protein
MSGDKRILPESSQSGRSLHRSWWQRIAAFFRKEQPGLEPEAEPESETCCNGNVHIAYRGLADDRMYMAYGRKWKEVRFFRPNGLRAFCADCRRRLL